MDNSSVLPTLCIKNRHKSTVMRIIHVKEHGLYFLLPKGVYLNYEVRDKTSVNMNIRWGIKGIGKDYSYSHRSIDGLMKMYLTQIRSDVSIQNSGLFTEDGLISPIARSVPINPREIFKTYDSELEAILAMRRILRLDKREIDVTAMVDAPWINLKELLK